MTEQTTQTTETNDNKPQPTEFALRSLEEVRLFREKIAQPVGRVWGLFVADLKQGWVDIVEGLKPKAKEPKAPKVKAEKPMVAKAPKAPKVKVVKEAPASTEPRLKKRTIVRVAFGNFRHSWKDAFAGMKLRYFIVPNSKKIDPKRMNWTQGKSIISILGGAAIGGAVGFMAYALPYVFLSAFYVGGPLLVLGVGVRAVGALIPKGDLKNAVRNIGKKTFATGVVCAMWPMVTVGAVAFAGLHATLTTAETLIKGFSASLRGAYLTLRGIDSEAPATRAPALPAPSADAPAQDFAANAPKAGADFAQAAADAAATAQQAAAPAADAKPAARKPR